MEAPLFSLLIANFNNGKFFKDCYDSIISQAYTNWEVIIVDDASTDNSLELIKEIIKDDSRFKLYENSDNKGCGYTKRKCAELATGDICAFLDPDDAITQEALEVMVAEHTKHPEASVISSTFYFCDQDLNTQYVTKPQLVENCNSLFFDFDGAITHFLTYKNRMYKMTIGIDSFLQRAVDKDLVFNLLEVGESVVLDTPLYRYRVHNGGISTNANQDKAYFWYWVAIINAARRRNVNIENLFIEKALISRREFYLQKEIDGYNKSVLFRSLRKLGLFKII